MTITYIPSPPDPSNTFKPGDVVVALSNENDGSGALVIKGMEYVVHHLSGRCIGLVGFPPKPSSGLPFGFWAHKFRLKERPSSTKYWLSDELWDIPMERA